MPVAVSGCHPIAGSCSDTVCVTGIALQPEPRSFVDGQIGRPLRGSLYLLLWRLAEEESHPARSDFLVGLRQALPGQPDLPAWHVGAGDPARSARESPT